MTREKEIYRVTLLGSFVNLGLVLFKFVAGILGASAAMVADAVHSLSDLATDIIVLVFVKISTKPADKEHNYGHGKYETLAGLIVGLCLLAVGAMLCKGGIEKILLVINGETLPVPGWIALVAAIVSIVSKEFVYRITASVGKKYKSDAVMANAWHHRSDALSSIGTGLGIGGALLLGSKWTVLDPVAAVIVSVLIVVASVKIILQAMSELLDRSLPKDIEDRIIEIVHEDKELSDIHHMRTRSVGDVYYIDMHLRIDGTKTLNYAHHRTRLIEQKLKAEFGTQTIVNLHLEPVKINGEYQL